MESIEMLKFINWWTNKDIENLYWRRKIDYDTLQTIMEIRDGVKSAIFFILLIIFIMGGSIYNVLH